MSAPRVGIVGGGILGTGLALRLAQQGAQVTVLERGPAMGGLAGAMDWNGHQVDRFYHVITPTDSKMVELAEEVGLGDQIRYRSIGAGFFIDGKLHDFNGALDLLRFSPLSPVARLRLAWFVAQCQLRSNYAELDETPIEPWLRRHCGKEVWERIWKPLLYSRFDSNPSGLPATYLWSRTRRYSGARENKAGSEAMGCIVGGHQRLIDAMVARAESLGVQARTGVPVEGLAMEGNRVAGVVADGETLPFDLTIATLQPPALKFLLPDSLQPLLAPYPKRWLGVVCVVLKLKRSVTPYYAVNIAEPTPITTVVETSQVLGTDHTDGLHLVYLPKYCDPSAPEQTEDDESVYRRFTAQLERISPNFTQDDVVDWTVQRAKLVEPVHEVRSAAARVAPVFPDVPGLVLASNAQIYPSLLSGNSVLTFAEQVSGQVGERLGLSQLAAVPAAADEAPALAA